MCVLWCNRRLWLGGYKGINVGCDEAECGVFMM